MKDAKDVRERIGKAKFEFLLKHPFLGELALRLAVREDASIKTMGTDMRSLYYNSDFVKKLDQKTLEGVIAHEVAHCLFLHAGKENLYRKIGKNPDIWTIACEYMANHFVKDLVELPLPQGCYYDKKYSDGTWTTDTVYHDILKNAKEVTVQILGEGGKKGSSGGMFDDHSKWGKESSDQGGGKSDGADQDWKIWIAQAAQNAKRQGKYPAWLERIVEEALEAKIPWKHELAEFLVHKAKDNYAWRKPNKRHLWRGVYAPALHSETINIAFGMDTSGSMSVEDLSEGLAELKSVCGAFASYRLIALACDAKVHFVQEITSSDEIDIKSLMRGGGGTSFVPVFEELKKEELKVDALIYFTDAYGDFPKEEPDFPVLWVVKGNGQVPFGRRIAYE